MKKISIITINYNNASGLEKTIKSVTEQNSVDYEYIVIDGGSDDGSKEIIEKYSGKITHWVSEKDDGIYDAMNKGIAGASGDYCLFLNSGDWLLNSEILLSVSKLNLSEDILYGELLFDFGNSTTKIGKLPDKLNIYYLFNGNIWHPATFIKTKLFQKFGPYNTTYKIAGDYDFFFNTIAIQKVSTHYVEFPISGYNTNGISSDASNTKLIQQERSNIHKKYLQPGQIEYLNNVSKFKVKFIAKWLVDKPRATYFFNKLFHYYSVLRN